MSQILSEPDRPLIEIAKSVCSKEEIDFNSLDSRQVRGLIYYWCSSCSKTYPLTHLVVSKRRNRCSHCNDKVKIYSNSNKYGKLRRRIFNRILDMRSAKAKLSYGSPDYDIKQVYEMLEGDMEKLESVMDAYRQDTEFQKAHSMIRKNMLAIRKLAGLASIAE
jgi:hypothetical protein